jgi:opacity protein-like surface antigen
MRNFLTAIVFGLAAVVLIALPASAAGPYGLSFSGAGIPFVSGDAGVGAGAPEYADAFDTGWGARIEPFYDFSPSFRGQIGITYQNWGGATISPGVKFDDLKMWAIYIGGKYRFLPGSKFRPYLVADVGYANLDSVDVSVGTATVPFWDRTGTYLVDAGVGVEYMVAPNLGIFIDVRGQMFGAPDEGLNPTAEADPGVSVPISVGVNYNF